MWDFDTGSFFFAVIIVVVGLCCAAVLQFHHFYYYNGSNDIPKGEAGFSSGSFDTKSGWLSYGNRNSLVDLGFTLEYAKTDGFKEIITHGKDGFIVDGKTKNNVLLEKIEGLECNAEIKLDLIKSLNCIPSTMKELHELRKFHLKKVNPSTN